MRDVLVGECPTDLVVEESLPPYCSKREKLSHPSSPGPSDIA